MVDDQDPPARDVTQELFRSLNRFVKPVVKAGLGSPLPIGLGAVVVESTGRKSGVVREVPVLGLRLGSKVFVTTVRDNSQWMKNLEASDEAGVWYCGERHGARASVQRGPLNVVTLDTDRDSGQSSDG
jgi:hypothetical protein